MTVGIRLAPTVYEIGTSDFLKAFFETVTYHLEPNGRGSVYPVLMNGLYSGSLRHTDADAGLTELIDIQRKLKEYAPSEIVWNPKNLNERPPWGDSIAAHIRDLSNYFVTSGGKDLIQLLQQVIGYLEEEGGLIEIVQYEGYPVGDLFRWDLKFSEWDIGRREG